MTVPDYAEIYEGELATFWFDENGILCANGKHIDRDLEKQKKIFELIKKISGNKKVCMLSDATSSKLQDDVTRKYIEEEIPKLFNAIAVISDTAFGKANTVIFKNSNKQSIPLEIFENAEEAKKWLQTFL